MTLAITGFGFTKVPTMPNNTVMADVVDDDDRGILPPQPIIDNNNGNSSENETTTGYVAERTTTSTDSKDTVVRKAPTIKVKKAKFTIKKKKGTTKAFIVKTIKKSITATDSLKKDISSRVDVSKPSLSSKKYNKWQTLTITVVDDYGNTTTKNIKLKLTKTTSVKKSKKLTSKSALYEKMSTKSKKRIKTVKSGTKVYVIHKIPNTGWYKVKIKGKTGYMKASKFKARKKTTTSNKDYEKTDKNGYTWGKDSKGEYVIIEGKKIYMTSGSKSDAERKRDEKRDKEYNDGVEDDPSWREK